MQLLDFSNLIVIMKFFLPMRLCLLKMEIVLYGDCIPHLRCSVKKDFGVVRRSWLLLISKCGLKFNYLELFYFDFNPLRILIQS